MISLPRSFDPPAGSRRQKSNWQRSMAIRITLMNKPPDLSAVNAVVFLSRAKGYLQHKQFKRALADLDEALRLNPQSGDALMVRATVRVEMGDYREALADVERRLQLEPPEPLALLTRGNLRAQLGELE